MAATPERLQALQRELRARHGAAGCVPLNADETAASSGRWLPEALRPGTVTEWLADGPGTPVVTLALRMARDVLAGGVTLAVIDREGTLYPPALAGLVDLERVVLVHPASDADALWAIEQALRCPAACVVLCRLGRASETALRRLQLAAEAGRSLGLLIRPASAQRERCWSAGRWLVSPSPAQDEELRRLRVRALSVRGAFPSEHAVELSLDHDLDHEAGAVRLVSAVADPEAVQRTARA